MCYSFGSVKVFASDNLQKNRKTEFAAPPQQPQSTVQIF